MTFWTISLVCALALLLVVVQDEIWAPSHVSVTNMIVTTPCRPLIMARIFLRRSRSSVRRRFRWLYIWWSICQARLRPLNPRSGRWDWWPRRKNTYNALALSRTIKIEAKIWWFNTPLHAYVTNIFFKHFLKNLDSKLAPSMRVCFIAATCSQFYTLMSCGCRNLVKTFSKTFLKIKNPAVWIYPCRNYFGVLGHQLLCG